MTRIVIDASATLLATSPLVVPEAAERWAELMRDHEAVAPALLAFEVGNVIHRKRPAEFGGSLDARLHAVGTALEGIALLPLEAGDVEAIARVCEEEQLSFYDAAYLELAERDDEALLVTDDDRLRRAATRRLGAERVLGL